jgi:hypothetical protein
LNSERTEFVGQIHFASKALLAVTTDAPNISDIETCEPMI